MDTPRFLRRKAAAQYLRDHWGLPRTAGTLAKLAVIGGGPIFRKAGRIPLYAPSELDRYAEAQLGRPLRSTSDGRETKMASANVKFHQHNTKNPSADSPPSEPDR